MFPFLKDLNIICVCAGRVFSLSIRKSGEIRDFVETFVFETGRVRYLMGCCGEPVHNDPHKREEAPKGPIKDRGCTDILCLGLFLAFLVGWGVVAVFAFIHGDPERLINPTDSYGNICGTGNFTSKKYLFYFDMTRCASSSILLTGCPTPQVCISSCPKYNFAALDPTMDLTKYQSSLICKYNVDLTKTYSNSELRNLAEIGDCAPYYLASSPVVGRCLPSFVNETGHNFLDAFGHIVINTNGQPVTNDSLKDANKFLTELMNAKQVGEMIFSDLKMSYVWILMGIVFAMVLSFIWIVLIRCLGGLMIWLSLFFMLALFSVACGFSFYRYKDLKGVPGSEDPVHFTTNFESYLSYRSTWLAFGIIAAIFLGIILLIVIFLRKRIRIAIALINESSKAVSHIMSALVFPLFPFVLQLIVFGFSGVVAVYLAATGKQTYKVFLYTGTGAMCQNYTNGSFCDPETFNPICGQCAFYDYSGDGNLWLAQFYNLFGFFWGMFFVDGLSQIILAGAFASWYWAYSKPKDVPLLPVCSSFGRTFRYHLGSVAFGSLIIAIVRMIRVMLEYADRKMKQYADNPVIKCIMCCLKCFFWCLEKFLKFINKNAYIMIAIYGKNFCTSAKNAFFLLLRNVLRTVVLDKVTDFLLFIGKLVVVGGLGVLSFFFFSGQIPGLEKYVPPLHYYFVPMIVIIIGSYMVASAFFGVYEMAVDTIFLCFLEDSECNDGSPEKPYFMSKRLMKILGKKNKKID